MHSSPVLSYDPCNYEGHVTVQSHAYLQLPRNNFGMMKRCYWGISSAGDRLPKAISAEYIVRLCFADGNRRLTQNTKTPPVSQPYTILASCTVT